MTTNDNTLLADVKTMLGIGGTAHDAKLTLFIGDVKFFMKDAGVPAAIVESEAAIGCIFRGVADLWNYGAGDGKLSPYFTQRLLQLKNKEAETEEGEG